MIVRLALGAVLALGVSGCHIAFDDPESDIRLCQEIGNAEIGSDLIVTDARKGTTGGRFFADCEGVHQDADGSGYHFDCYGVWYDNHDIRYRYSNGDDLCPI